MSTSLSNLWIVFEGNKQQLLMFDQFDWYAVNLLTSGILLPVFLCISNI